MGAAISATPPSTATAMWMCLVSWPMWPAAAAVAIVPMIGTPSVIAVCWVWVSRLVARVSPRLPKLLDHHRPHSYSVVLRLKKWDAAGAATARITTDQISAAATGCCIGHAWIVPDGFGFPQSTRVPATTALTGFQVVIV
jgi:hypothetical protein